MADLTGQRLGPFEIQSLLGTGGFASVYRAHDPRLNSDVAIKLLAENHALDPTMRTRFIGEAHALRRVSSPSVISIFDIQETEDGRPYLVLEHADRGTLSGRRHSIVTNGGSPSVADVLFVVDALAEALDAIHAENLVHRDITPANLLLRSSRRSNVRPQVTMFEPDEKLLLSDMGLVKDLGDGSALTIGGGTAGFWSPEQRGPYTTVDGRSDLWAATAVVVWLITGTPPAEHLGWTPQVRKMGFGENFIRALERGLQTEVDERPATAVEWQTSLHTAANRQPELATAPTPDAAVTQLPKTPEPQRNRAMSIAAGIALVVVIGLGALLVMRNFALNPDAEARPNGEVAVTSMIDEAELTIVGPERFVVGETAIYRAEVVDATSLTWTDPSGSEWSTEVLEVTASSPGQGTVAAAVRTNDGRVLRAELQFEAES